MRSNLKVVPHLLSHIVLPQHCGLCGALVRQVPWYPAPLCASCEAQLEFIQSPRCARCGRPLISEVAYCMECRDQGLGSLKILPLFMFQGNVARLLHLYKNQERFTLANYFAYRLLPLVASICPEPDEVSVVPVPPRPEKMLLGRLDQVGVLAQGLGKYGFKHSDVLMRRAGSHQQKTLDKAKRQENAALSFVLRNPNLPHLAILLDDVCTTGATLEACAKILREHGTEVIGAVVVAAD